MFKLEQWYLKTFRRSDIVKLIYTSVDKRIISLYVIPIENTITYNDQSFLLIPERVYSNNGIPTVYANYKNAELIDIYDTRELEKEKGDYTPKMFNTAITAKVVEQLYKASKNAFDGLIPLLMIAVIAVVVYQMYVSGQNYNAIIERLSEIQPVTP